ncbi:MAG: hypothetical protein RL518_1351 [Pseudomonadota bacterium]
MKIKVFLTSMAGCLLFGWSTNAVGEPVAAAVCDIKTLEAIPEVLSRSGVSSLGELCPLLEKDGKNQEASFASLNQGPAGVGTAFGSGVLKCILEWCGYGAKKSDPPGVPKPNVNLKPYPEPKPGRPELPPHLQPKGQPRGNKPGMGGMTEGDLPPGYKLHEVSPEDWVEFERRARNAPRKKKPEQEYPTEPVDTSREEVTASDGWMVEFLDMKKNNPKLTQQEYWDWKEFEWYQDWLKENPKGNMVQYLDWKKRNGRSK